MLSLAACSESVYVIDRHDADLDRTWYGVLFFARPLNMPAIRSSMVLFFCSASGASDRLSRETPAKTSSPLSQRLSASGISSATCSAW